METIKENIVNRIKYAKTVRIAFRISDVDIDVIVDHKDLAEKLLELGNDNDCPFSSTYAKFGNVWIEPNWDYTE